VKEKPSIMMKFISTCHRRLTHALLEDGMNDHLAQMIIHSILIMGLMKKFLNSFCDG
jgi:hypothetical protein